MSTSEKGPAAALGFESHPLYAQALAWADLADELTARFKRERPDLLSDLQSAATDIALGVARGLELGESFEPARDAAVESVALVRIFLRLKLCEARAGEAALQALREVIQSLDAAPASDETASPFRVVLCNAPADEAPKIAKALVEERLAACVNLLSGVRSIYRWEGDICDDGETTLLIKTTRPRLDALTARVRELHSYSVPEVISLVVRANEGEGAYLRWLGEQVSEATTDGA